MTKTSNDRSWSLEAAVRWARLVLAVSLMVGWTSAAAAEGAWVLWEKVAVRELTRTVTTSFWMVHAGYPEHRDCTRSLESMFNERTAVLQPDPGVRELKQNQKRAVLWYTKGGISYQNRLACLPDALDPREKKE